MKDYIKRMISESEELNRKIALAEKMVCNPLPSMTATSVDLLKSQIECMNSYSRVLNIRIQYELKYNN